MSLVAVAVCPHPPLLVPELAQGAAAELDGLRAACDEAVRRMLAASPVAVVVIGPASDDRWYPPAERGDFRRFGASGDAVVLDGRGGAGGGGLPLSVTVGAWLLRRAPAQVTGRGRGVRPDTPTARCLAAGGEIADLAPRVGLLVMGDGSARRTEKAPGDFHPEAATFDATVAAALGSADADRLVKLDPAAAAELMAAGRAPWQVLAGAGGDRNWRADLLYNDAPYGVGYVVASWR